MVKVKAFKCDTGDSQQVDHSIEEIHKEFGKKVDIAICNAGAYRRTASSERSHFVHR